MNGRKTMQDGLWEGLKDFMSYRKAKKMMLEVNKLQGWRARIVEEEGYNQREVRINQYLSMMPPTNERLVELFDLLGKFSTKFKISYYAFYSEYQFKVSVKIGGI